MFTAGFEEYFIITITQTFERVIMKELAQPK